MDGAPAGSPQPAPQPSAPGPCWDDLELAHASLPEIDLDEVDCSLVFLGRPLRLPLLIDASAADGLALVAPLARAAARCGAALVVAFRPAARGARTIPSPLAAARDAAPDAVLIGAVAASQLLDGRNEPAAKTPALRSALRAAGAAALAVQLDFLHSTTELRGQGLAATLAALARGRGAPVIVRAGAGGLMPQAALRLKECGAAALDAGGRDATSPAAGGTAFQDWGVPAAASIINAARAGLPVVGGAGVRHGLDAAKAIAAGAALVAVGEPLLASAREGEAAAAGWIEQFEVELRAAMFLTGSRTLADLRRQRPVILGATLEWLKRQDTQASFT